MSAPVAIDAWQARRVDKRSRATALARLERLEDWQNARYQALEELSELIGRKQLEIDNLRAQLSKEISA